MSAIAGGVVTTIAGASYTDVPDEIVSSAISKDLDLPKEPGRKSNNLRLSIETILMSAFIFIAILSWFEFLRVLYENVFPLDGIQHFNIVYNRFWYAIFITALVIVLLYIVYRIYNPW